MRCDTSSQTRSCPAPAMWCWHPYLCMERGARDAYASTRSRATERPNWGPYPVTHGTTHGTTHAVNKSLNAGLITALGRGSQGVGRPAAVPAFACRPNVGGSLQRRRFEVGWRNRHFYGRGERHQCSGSSGGTSPAQKLACGLVRHFIWRYDDRGSSVSLHRRFLRRDRHMARGGHAVPCLPRLGPVRRQAVRLAAHVLRLP